MSGSDPSSGRIVLQQLQFVQQLYNPPPDLRREPPLHKGALIRRYREYLKHTVQLRSYSLPPWSRLTPPDDEAKYRYAWFAGGRVFGVSRVRLFPFLMLGISRLRLRLRSK